MKKIILITGISGSGKTSLAKYLNQYYEKSVLISMDILKESIYDIVGFSTYEQKQNLKKIVYQTFLQLLQECMDREDETIILEYPFSKRWETSFQSFVEKYQYDAVTIRIRGENFDTIYN